LTKLTVYFAGPSVFLPNAKEYGDRLKRKAQELGFIGIYPCDGEIETSGLNADKEIFQLNMASVGVCDVVIAELGPFRGTEPDSGTVWEIATAKALGKLVIGCIPRYRDMIHLVSEMWAVEKKDGRYIDEFGNFIEDFGRPLNLMICNGVDHLIEGDSFDGLLHLKKMFSEKIDK